MDTTAVTMAGQGHTARLETHLGRLEPDQVASSATAALSAAAEGKQWKTVEYLAGVLDGSPPTAGAEGGAPDIPGAVVPAPVTFRAADPHRPEEAYGSTRRPATGISLAHFGDVPLVGASDAVVPERIRALLTLPGCPPKRATLLSDGTRKSIARAISAAYRAVLDAGGCPVTLSDLSLIRLTPGRDGSWAVGVAADSHAGGHDAEAAVGPPPFPYKRRFLKDSPEDYFRRLQTREYVRKSKYVKPRGYRKKVWPPGRGLEWRYDGKPFALVVQANEYAEVGSLTDFFTEDARMAARVGAGPSPKEAWDDPATRAAIALKAAEIDPKDPHGLYALREGVYHVASEATSFKTSLAASVCRLFKATAVLDPSAGWGDRALGAAASGNVARYVGIDPNPALAAGYGKIVRFVGESSSATRVGFRQMGAEEYTAADLADDFPDGPPDLVFTSPPFFDFEVYSADEKQSASKHPTLDSWVNGWLLPTMSSFWRFLAPGGTLAIYIADAGGHNIVAPLVRRINTLASQARPKAGRFRGVIACRLTNKRPVPLLVWQK